MDKRIAIALMLVLAACAGPTTEVPSQRSMATWSTMTYAVARGPMLVEAGSGGFGLAPRELAARLAPMMSGQVMKRRFAFTADPAAAPHPEKRVVVALDAAPSASGSDLCAGRGSAMPSQAGQVRVIAAFCEGDTPLSSVRGRVGNISGVDDPRFRALMGHITRQLFGNDDESRLQSDKAGLGF